MTSFILNSEGWLLGLFTFAMLMYPVRVMLLAQISSDWLTIYLSFLLRTPFLFSFSFSINQVSQS